MSDLRTDYATVAASQTKAVLGPVGGQGDILMSLMIIPATLAAGNVTLYDGSGSTGISVFTTGTLSDLKPIVLKFCARAKTAANPGWFITTGANVSVIATGKFT